MGTRALPTATDAPAADFYLDRRDRPTMTLEQYELQYELRREHAQHLADGPVEPSERVWLGDVQRGMLREKSGSQCRCTILRYTPTEGWLVRIGWMGSQPLLARFATYETLAWQGDEIVPVFLAEHGVAAELPSDAAECNCSNPYCQA